jgi:hypothetical protein
MGGSKNEKPAIIRRIFACSWFRLNIFCLNLWKRPAADLTINIFSKGGCPVEYANIGIPFIQNCFPLIYFNSFFHILLNIMYAIGVVGPSF